jgi:hypothetical protein
VVLACASIYGSNLYRVDEERRARGALDHGQGASRKDSVDEGGRREWMAVPRVAEAGLNVRLHCFLECGKQRHRPRLVRRIGYLRRGRARVIYGLIAAVNGSQMRQRASFSWGRPKLKKDKDEGLRTCMSVAAVLINSPAMVGGESSLAIRLIILAARVFASSAGRWADTLATHRSAAAAWFCGRKMVNF